MEQKAALSPNANNLIHAEEIMHPLRGKGGTSGSMFTKKLLVLLIITALLGSGTGFAIAKSGAGSTLSGVKNLAPGVGPAKGKIFGVESTEGLDDPAEGVLKEGGMDGEGAFHLEREGGESQTVYMTSANVDLSEFINKKVRVWGNSQTPEKVGWLLDVKRVEVL